MNIGFIVEGDSEKIVVDSSKFREFITSCGLTLTAPVINATGQGNLRNDHFKSYINRLRALNVAKIFVITDQDRNSDPNVVRNPIQDADVDGFITYIFVANMALESWFLADSAAMSHWLGVPRFRDNAPETGATMPWDRLGNMVGVRGPSKPVFARNFVENHGFSIVNAAMHGACPSASEMVTYLTAMAPPAPEV